MKYLTVIFITGLVVMLGAGAERHDVKLNLPDHVLINETLYGWCTAKGPRAPRIRVLYGGKCSVKTFKGMEENSILGYSQVDFMVENVTTTCVYQCFLARSRPMKKVSVVEANISPPSNKTVIKKMPVTINCTITTNVPSNHHKLVWMENSTFVESDDHYTTSQSSTFEYKTNIHFLTIHKVLKPAYYTCMLISTSGNIIDAAIQYIFVDELNEGDSSVLKQLLEYLSHYFKWR